MSHPIPTPIARHTIMGMEVGEFSIPTNGKARLVWCRLPFDRLIIEGSVSPVFSIVGQGEKARTILKHKFEQYWRSPRKYVAGRRDNFSGLSLEQ